VAFVEEGVGRGRREEEGGKGVQYIRKETREWRLAEAAHPKRARAGAPGMEPGPAVRRQRGTNTPKAPTGSPLLDLRCEERTFGKGTDTTSYISLLYLEALATSDSKNILFLARACSPNSSGCRKPFLPSRICCPADIVSCSQRCNALYSHCPESHCLLPHKECSPFTSAYC
jgi:hypothetical protein